MRQRLRDYLLLLRLDRPVGIYLLLWPTLWALWFAADGVPSLHVLLVFVLGTVLMRSAGCAINDYADRNFDPHVSRTRNRPLAAGRITAGETLKNTLALALAVPAVVLTVLYPFMKRWISMPQAVLGVAFSWGIPMAYAAVLHRVDIAEAGILMLANVCWVIAYDTYYAMADREDDLKIGVRSTAILFGRHDRLMILLLQAATLMILLGLGISRGFGVAYGAGLAVAAVIALLQQRATRTRDPAACLRAFLNNHYFGTVIFLGLALDRMLAA
jgi:4-hydroxybenzoate polyprenyltransferase